MQRKVLEWKTTKKYTHSRTTTIGSETPMVKTIYKIFIVCKTNMIITSMVRRITKLIALSKASEKKSIVDWKNKLWNIWFIELNFRNTNILETHPDKNKN